MKSNTLSAIAYKIVIVEGVSINTHTFTFDRLFNNNIGEGEDFEFVYALEFYVERILKLSVGESIYFKANRDMDSKGIIVRIN
jgi:hypothetical protein